MIGEEIFVNPYFWVGAVFGAVGFDIIKTIFEKSIRAFMEKMIK
jgi:hypothetical protein